VLPTFFEEYLDVLPIKLIEKIAMSH